MRAQLFHSCWSDACLERRATGEMDGWLSGINELGTPLISHLLYFHIYEFGCLPTLVLDWIPTGSRLAKSGAQKCKNWCPTGSRRDPDWIHRLARTHSRTYFSLPRPHPCPYFPFPRTSRAPIPPPPAPKR